VTPQVFTRAKRLRSTLAFERNPMLQVVRAHANAVDCWCCLVCGAFRGGRISRQSVLWSIHEIPSIIRTAQNALHLRCYAENQCRPGSYPVDSAIVTRGARFVGWPLLRWNFFEPQLTSIPRRAAVNGREVDANDSCPLGPGVPRKRLQGSRAFLDRRE
jgi:hypothetical protein